jgi:hypothetical protein
MLDGKHECRVSPGGKGETHAPPFKFRTEGRFRLVEPVISARSAARTLTDATVFAQSRLLRSIAYIATCRLRRERLAGGVVGKGEYHVLDNPSCRRGMRWNGSDKLRIRRDLSLRRQADETCLIACPEARRRNFRTVSSDSVHVSFPSTTACLRSSRHRLSAGLDPQAQPGRCPLGP